MASASGNKGTICRRHCHRRCVAGVGFLLCGAGRSRLLSTVLCPWPAYISFARARVLEKVNPPRSEYRFFLLTRATFYIAPLLFPSTIVFAATPANLLSLRNELAEVALQIDAEDDLFVRKGVAINYLRRALKTKDADIDRLRQAIDARDTDIRNLGDRMESVHRLLKGVLVK